MFEFILKMSIGLSVYSIVSFSGSLASNSGKNIKCVPLISRSYQTRATIVEINSNKTLFYPFNVSVNKCGGRCKSRVSDPNKEKV